MMSNCSALILAAGDGARMKTTIPYVMLKVLSRPMLGWVLSAVQKSGVAHIGTVVANRNNAVAQYVKNSSEIFEQSERKGTAHAVMQAIPFLEAHPTGNVILLNGDMPFMDAGILRSAVSAHVHANNDVTVITAHLENPFGYGRILRNYSDGSLKGILEERDASSQMKRIKEVSAGTYIFKVSALLRALQHIQLNQVGEYNLIDTIPYLLSIGGKADTFTAPDPDVVLGANDRAQLYLLNCMARRKVLEMHREAGVNIPCADGIMIDPEVEIGTDTTILPNTILQGAVHIGSHCHIGPNVLIADSTLGNAVQLRNVDCTGASIGDNSFIGSFVHVRTGMEIGQNAFVENNVTFEAPVIIGNNVHVPAGTVVKENILADELTISPDTETTLEFF